MDSSTSANIMIVGEDSHFCYLLRSYIRRSGYTTQLAHPDINVTSIVLKEKPAVIILDVDLPGMVGWNLLRALRSGQETREIPVVICSWTDETERGAKEGASVYLRMPILYTDFLMALDKVGLPSDKRTAQA